MLQAVRFGVHLVPGKIHHLNQEDLQQAVAAHKLERRQKTLLGQRDAVHA